MQAQAKRKMVADAAGLRLLVRPTGKMIWIYRYSLCGKPGEVTLGRYPHLSLAEARQRRSGYRHYQRDGPALDRTVGLRRF